MENSIDEANFTVVDVETTGLASTDRVIEVACVRLRGMVELERFQSLVNPGMPIPEASSHLSGITDSMVADAPLFPEIAPQLDRLLDGSVFVAHNAPFDLGFLSRERGRWKLPPWKGPVLDTLRLARNVLDFESYSLGALRQALLLEHTPCHRAMDDVLATVALLGRLIQTLDPRPRLLAELMHAQEPHPLSWEDAKTRGFAAHLIDTLAEAARRQQLVELEYRSLKGESVHWVLPRGLEHNGPLHYLRASFSGSEDARTYRLDRIVGVHLPGTSKRTETSGDSSRDDGETTG